MDRKYLWDLRRAIGVEYAGWDTDDLMEPTLVVSSYS